jgi:hypothetical protein
MKTILPILIFFSSSLIFAKNTAPILDGIVKEQEWQDAQNFSLDYEIDPGISLPFTA